jgi:hypothetical protein
MRLNILLHENNLQTKSELSKNFFHSSSIKFSPRSKKDIYLDTKGNHNTTSISIGIITNKTTGIIELFTLYNVMTKKTEPQANKYYCGPNHDLELIVIEGKNYGENKQFQTSMTPCLYGVKVGNKINLEACLDRYTNNELAQYCSQYLNEAEKRGFHYAALLDYTILDDGIIMEDGKINNHEIIDNSDLNIIQIINDHIEDGIVNDGVMEDSEVNNIIIYDEIIDLSEIMDDTNLIDDYLIQANLINIDESKPNFYEIPLNLCYSIPVEKHNDFVNFLNDLSELNKEGILNLAELIELVMPFINIEDIKGQEFLKIAEKEINLSKIKPSETKLLSCKKYLFEIKNQRDKKVIELLPDKSKNILLKELDKNILDNSKQKNIIIDIIKPIETI